MIKQPTHTKDISTNKGCAGGPVKWRIHPLPGVCPDHAAAIAKNHLEYPCSDTVTLWHLLSTTPRDAIDMYGKEGRILRSVESVAECTLQPIE